jgi:integrase
MNRALALLALALLVACHAAAHGGADGYRSTPNGTWPHLPSLYMSVLDSDDQRRDVDRDGCAVTVQRRYAEVLTRYPKSERSRRRVPLTTRAFQGIESLPPRLDTPILFPAPVGGYVSLDNWWTREWYDALDAAGIELRGPYHLRHTFATEALAAGVAILELARLMGTR